MSGNSKFLRPVLWAALSLALLGSCGKDIPEDAPAPGGGISFSPSTAGSPSTKTTYTGDGTFTGTAPDQTLANERIDWVDGDLFTIVCAQAKVYDTSTRPWKLVYSVTSPSAYSTADYRVKTHQTENATVSRATIEAVDKGLQWDKNAGDHTFHALYPAASTAGYSTEEKAKVGITPTGFSATIPTAQTPRWTDNGWPEMRYAYMYATRTTAANAQSVNLPFHPQFTAFEFTVEAGENESVSLSSFTFEAVDANAAVTGDFSYSFADGTVTPSGKSNKITVDLSGRSVSAAVGTTPARNLSFTVLGLPVNMTAMRMTFTGTEIGTRTLVLKHKNGSEITFSARKKYRIKGIQFPKNGASGGGEQIIWDQEAFGEDILWDEDQYILEGTIPATLPTSHFGGTVTLATDFRSCVVDGSDAIPEPFVFQYSATGADGSWTDGLPDWLSPADDGDMLGYTSAKTLRLTAYGQSAWSFGRSIYVRILQTNSGKTTSACKLTQDFIGFTVDANGRKVMFARGNLVVTYKSDGNHLWAFESNQWDYSYGTGAGQSYPGKSDYLTDGMRISHFGWGTSGLGTARPPYEISSDNSLYTWSDWGKHFDDAGNGLNSRSDGTWFTLAGTHWEYLGEKRDNHASLIGQGRIYVVAENRYVNGLVLLPDNWVKPSGCQFTPGYDIGFTTNTYTTGTSGYNGRWSDMEASGAVFLPAAGGRYEGLSTTVAWSFAHAENIGDYWTSTNRFTSAAVAGFGNTHVSFGGGGNSYYRGLAVRLVHD